MIASAVQAELRQRAACMHRLESEQSRKRRDRVCTDAPFSLKCNLDHSEGKVVSEFNLGTWANIADIIGAGSIVTGLIVGWIQIRHLRRQQCDAVAINLAQTF